MRTFLTSAFIFLALTIGCQSDGPPGFVARHMSTITTNYVPALVTNAVTGEVTITNKPVYTFERNPEVEGNIRGAAQTVGGFWGVGGIASTVAGVLYGGLITFLNWKKKRANASLAQGTEVALEIFKSISPALEAKYKSQLISTQELAGTKETIATVVSNDVDENAARVSAAETLTLAQSTPPPQVAPMAVPVTPGTTPLPNSPPHPLT